MIRTRSPLLNRRSRISGVNVGEDPASGGWLRSRASLEEVAIATALRTASTTFLVIVRPSIQRPQRQRADVFDENPIARDGRLSPGRAVRDSVPFQRFECLPAAPRHDQLGV